MHHWRMGEVWLIMKVVMDPIQMIAWFDICVACTPISSTITPITSPIMLCPEKINIINEKKPITFCATQLERPWRSLNKIAWVLIDAITCPNENVAISKQIDVC